MKKRRNYIKLSDPIPVGAVIDAMRKGEKLFFVPGAGMIGIDSVRMLTYLKGTKCVTCGLEASFFMLERMAQSEPHGRPHLNLYIDMPGMDPLMMTSDHIIPKSRGGNKRNIENRQPMCIRCNITKGNLLPGEIRENYEEKRRIKIKAKQALTIYSKLIGLTSAIKRGMPIEKFFQLRAGGIVYIERNKEYFSELQWNNLQHSLLLV